MSTIGLPLYLLHLLPLYYQIWYIYLFYVSELITARDSSFIWMLLEEVACRCIQFAQSDDAAVCICNMLPCCNTVALFTWYFVFFRAMAVIKNSAGNTLNRVTMIGLELEASFYIRVWILAKTIMVKSIYLSSCTPYKIMYPWWYRGTNPRSNSETRRRLMAILIDG